MDNTERSRRAYQAGAKVTRERMRQEAPEAAAALEAVSASDVVVVRGVYDHVELVLEALELPYQVISQEEVAGVTLRPEQLLVINCPGQVGERAIPRIRAFVADGGSLFTTDWALKHVLEPAFPGIVAYNERPTVDDVVRIELCGHDNAFIAGVLGEGDDPLWWLEGSSYPIRILDPERVTVLLKSKELADRYGEEPVAITFPYEKGEVFHLISHYYLQRTELRTARHQEKAATYAVSKGVALAPENLAAMADLNFGDVAAAESSTRLFSNIIAAKKQRAQDQEKKE